MKTVTLPCGETVPSLGQGSWKIGSDPARRQEEIATLRSGIDLGMTLVDTAEMYGEGESARSTRTTRPRRARSPPANAA